MQQEARLERQEDRLHAKAVNAALHGNIGKAVALEVGEKKSTLVDHELSLLACMTQTGETTKFLACIICMHAATKILIRSIV